MESKQYAAILIGFFLMITFVYFFGSPLTGYSVGGMTDSKDITLENYPYPFLKNGIYNSLILVTDYDEFSSSLGEELATYLKGSKAINPQIVQELDFNKNQIVVADSCSQIIKNIIGESDCNTLKDNTGVIEILEMDGRNILIVSGKNTGIRKAVTVLENYNFYNLKGIRAEVTGSPKSTLSLQIKEFY